MNKIFKNPELKSIILKLAILQIVFMILISLFIRYEYHSINKEISRKNIAIAGKVLLIYPELEDEIVSIITKEASPEEIKKGQAVLERYGYTGDIRVLDQSSLKNLYPKTQLTLVMFITIYLIVILALIIFEYMKIYSKVNRVSEASIKVVHRDYSIVLPEENEGDFSVLYHHFNQMSNRLKSNLEHLKEDKIFLKDIISDISHQFKTPLSSLIMLNELMLNDENMEDGVKRDFLSRSQAQLERIEWLTINLLKMARLEAGAIDFKKETMPLIFPVDEALSSLDLKIKEKRQNILIDNPSPDVIFIGDKDWTAEALINIIKNCIEHTQEDGTIDIRLSETPIFSRIVIKDNGEGIEKKDIPHIFKRFYKGSSSVKIESIGIGLALSKTIIEAQNETISVKSRRGKGTEFTITFLKGVI